MKTSVTTLLLTWITAIIGLQLLLVQQTSGQNYLNGFNLNPVESEMTCKDARYQDKCYYFGLSLEWWIGAVEQCKKIGYQLVRIKNTDEANFLAKHLRNTGFRYFWVDASDDGHEGLWLSADQKPSFIGFFAPGEPNGEKYENCGELTINDNGVGRLNDMYCNNWRKYICERKSELVCGRGGYQDRCYWFSMHPSTWYQAREHCQSLGMRLARVGGAETATFIAQHQAVDSSWVDVRYGNSAGGFTYSDGAQLSSNWLNNAGLQPNGGSYMQKCGEVRAYGTTEGRISGIDCMVMRHFVCERAPMSTSSVGSESDQLLGLPSGLSSASAAGRRRRDAEQTHQSNDDDAMSRLLPFLFNSTNSADASYEARPLLDSNEFDIDSQLRHSVVNENSHRSFSPSSSSAKIDNEIVEDENKQHATAGLGDAERFLVATGVEDARFEPNAHQPDEPRYKVDELHHHQRHHHDRNHDDDDDKSHHRHHNRHRHHHIARQQLLRRSLLPGHHDHHHKQRNHRHRHRKITVYSKVVTIIE